MYFDRNATQSAAKRRGSGGMDRRSSPHRENWAAWVSPQAGKPAPRPRRVPEPSPRGRGADRGFDRRRAVDGAGPGRARERRPVLPVGAFTPAPRPGGPRRKRPQPSGWLPSRRVPGIGEMARDRRDFQSPAASPSTAPRRGESRFCLVVRGRAGQRVRCNSVCNGPSVTSAAEAGESTPWQPESGPGILGKGSPGSAPSSPRRPARGCRHDP